MDKLKQQLMQQMVDQMSSAMQNMTPQDMQRMKDMMAALNEMIEKRERGEDPGFEQFMEQFGDFFPENPQIARRAARADGPADGGDAGDAQLDDARAARPAAAAQRSAARRHGPALADGPARPEPAGHVPEHELGPVLRHAGHGPDGHGPGDADDAGARRAGSAGEPDAQRHQPRRVGRGRHEPGARPDGRRRRPLVGTPRRADQDAAGRRPDRAEGRPPAADAEGPAQDRQQRPARPVHQADQGQDRSAPDGSPRPRATSAPTRPSRTSTATRSTSTCTARSATPCGATVRARRCACHPTTSRSSAPST